MERPGDIKDRIGIDIGVKTSIEDAIIWAAEQGIGAL